MFHNSVDSKPKQNNKTVDFLHLHTLELGVWNSLRSMDNFAFQTTSRPTFGLRLFADIRQPVHPAQED